MKPNTLFLLAGLMLAGFAVQAQKALPIQVENFLTGFQMPQNCNESYHICTIQTDPSSGLVSVKDAGKITELQTKLQEDLKELGMSLMNGAGSAPTMPSMPSQTQMAQTQQNAMNMQGMTPEQAMQMAQSMSHQHAAPQVPNMDLMKDLGKAQTAGEEMSVTVNELTTKITQLEGEAQQKVGEVKRTGSCPDVKVKGADLALPKCSCVKEIELDFYNRRIAIENNYLDKINAILQSYMPNFKAQIGIMDKLEADMKYGDAVSMPALKPQIVGLQLQELNYAGTVLGMLVQIVEDSGGEYAGVVNVNNGHLSEDCQ